MKTACPAHPDMTCGPGGDRPGIRGDDRIISEQVVDMPGNLFRLAGAAPAGFYYYSQHPVGTMIHFVQKCHCRKPQPVLVLGAACDHGTALDRSWYAGDILDDIKAGQRASC
jgi:histidinol phosphatase-like enzyme